MFLLTYMWNWACVGHCCVFEPPLSIYLHKISSCMLGATALNLWLRTGSCNNLLSCDRRLNLIKVQNWEVDFLIISQSDWSKILSFCLYFARKMTRRFWVYKLITQTGIVSERQTFPQVTLFSSSHSCLVQGSDTLVTSTKYINKFVWWECRVWHSYLIL